jgi:hypothetical protein
MAHRKRSGRLRAVPEGAVRRRHRGQEGRHRCACRPGADETVCARHKPRRLKGPRQAGVGPKKASSRSSTLGRGLAHRETKSQAKLFYVDAERGIPGASNRPRASDIRLTLDPPSAEVARQRGTPAFQTLFQRREEFGCAIRFPTSTDATAVSSSHLTLCWRKRDSNPRSPVRRLTQRRSNGDVQHPCAAVGHARLAHPTIRDDYRPYPRSVIAGTNA